jgi:Tol biopolymer transport system component
MVLVVLLLAITLTATAPAQAAFPGTNGLIAFVRHDRIWVTDARGNDTGLMRGNDPAWSPDGTRIAFDRLNRGTGAFHIWTMRADGSERTRMTSGWGYNVEPGWSPDGSQLVFAGFDPSNQSLDLYTLDASTSLAPSAPRTAVTDTPGDEHHPEWAPDGSRIAFDRLRCGGSACGSRIGTVAPDGGDYRMLSPGAVDVNELFPDWSPDSTSLVFESDRNGIAPQYSDIYTMSASGDHVMQLTSGGAWNEEPAWAPDGTRIVYAHTSHVGRVALWMRSPNSASSRYVTGVGTYGGFPDWQSLPP